jgi:hypothetical protein
MTKIFKKNTKKNTKKNFIKQSKKMMGGVGDFVHITENVWFNTTTKFLYDDSQVNTYPYQLNNSMIQFSVANVGNFIYNADTNGLYYIDQVGNTNLVYPRQQPDDLGMSDIPDEFDIPDDYDTGMGMGDIPDEFDIPDDYDTGMGMGDIPDEFDIHDDDDTGMNQDDLGIGQKPDEFDIPDDDDTGMNQDDLGIGQKPADLGTMSQKLQPCGPENSYRANSNTGFMYVAAHGVEMIPLLKTDKLNRIIPPSKNSVVIQFIDFADVSTLRRKIPKVSVRKREWILYCNFWTYLVKMIKIL